MSALLKAALGGVTGNCTSLKRRARQKQSTIESSVRNKSKNGGHGGRRHRCPLHDLQGRRDNQLPRAIEWSDEALKYYERQERKEKRRQLRQMLECEGL